MKLRRETALWVGLSGAIATLTWWWDPGYSFTWWAALSEGRWASGSLWAGDALALKALSYRCYSVLGPSALRAMDAVAAWLYFVLLWSALRASGLSLVQRTVFSLGASFARAVVMVSFPACYGFIGIDLACLASWLILSRAQIRGRENAVSLLLGVGWANFFSLPALGFAVLAVLFRTSPRRSLAERWLCYAAGLCLNPAGLGVLLTGVFSALYFDPDLPAVWTIENRSILFRLIPWVLMALALVPLLFSTRRSDKDYGAWIIGVCLYLLAIAFEPFRPLFLAALVFCWLAHTPSAGWERWLSPIGMVLLAFFAFSQREKPLPMPERALAFTQAMLPGLRVSASGTWAEWVETELNTSSRPQTRKYEVWRVHFEEKRSGATQRTPPGDVLFTKGADVLIYPSARWNPPARGSWIRIYENPLAGVAVRRAVFDSMQNKLRNYYALRDITVDLRDGYSVKVAYRQNPAWVVQNEETESPPSAASALSKADYYFSRQATDRALEVLRASVTGGYADPQVGVVLAESLMEKAKWEETRILLDQLDALRLRDARLSSIRLYLQSASSGG